MAVTYTDRRTILNEGDAITGWTGAAGTTTTDFVESPAAVQQALNIATGNMFFTTTAIDLSDTLVYVWLFNNALQGSWTTGATSLFLGDGTDQVAFHIAGGDRFAFRHLEGPVNWNSCVLDGSQAATKNTAGDTTIVAGSFAGLGLNAITQVGGRFITLSKALGGGYNVAVDIIRYGNLGIRITGGGVGTEGRWAEIATADRSTANQAGHGVVRELQPIAFGVQAPITFGDTGAATNSYFFDEGLSVVFENWDIGNDKYFFNVEGNSGATNSFELRNCTIASAGPFVSVDCSGGFINTLTFESCVFSALGNGLLFSNNADATGHTVRGCLFNSCGQIDPGDVTFEGNTVQNSTAGATGAVLLDADGTSNWSGLSFVGGTGDGHGIYITAAGTYSFTNISFSLFGANGTTDAAVYNNSGGLVTINIVGTGDTPTVRNGASASTVVSNTVAISVIIQDTLGSEISGVRVLIEADSGGALPSDDSVTITRSGSTATVTHTAHGIVTGQRVAIRFAAQIEYNGIYTVTVTNANTYTYTVAGTPATPATGLITSTAVILDGTTDVNGFIENTGYSFGGSQPIRGAARKSTTSPYYRSAQITGVIEAIGFSTTVLMIADE